MPPASSFTVVDWVLGPDAGILARAIGVVTVWALPITIWISVIGLFFIWLERKVAGHIQCRLGPMEVGPHGALQTVADGVKLLAKEDLVPKDADRFLFGLAPILAFAATMVGFAVVPFGPNLIIADLDIGIFYLAAIGSLEAIGIVAAGWSSNNKWSLLGAVRAATQVVSYEIPLALSFLTVIVLAGSMRMTEIVVEQQGWLTNWFLFRNPFVWIAFVISFIAQLAECKRAPFDLPEAESELVSGFHTEYSGMRFAIFFLAEYAQMYLVSAVAVVLFLGGWYTGIAPLDKAVAGSALWANALGAVVIISKSFFLVFIQMWLRWTLPRIRLDQMMYLCLKVLLPFSIVVLLLSTFWEALLPDQPAVGVAVCVLMLVGGALYVRKVLRATPSFMKAVRA
jgi:NADH-quinone oxidoreductase subunit H